MANDITADRNTGAQLEPNETSFLNKDVLDVAKESAAATREFFTPEPSVDEPMEPESKPFNIIAARENAKSYSADGLSFTGNVAYEMGHGLTNNISALISDYANARPEGEELQQALADKAMALTEQYGWDTTMMDELMTTVASPEELERRASRISTEQAYMASLENTSMTQQILAGFTGFVADPVNLIPGIGVYKAFNIAGKVLPKVANVSKRAAVTGNIVNYAAMGAVEEAIRNYPRTMADPTYSYEMYRMDIAMGAGFGGGLASLMPAAAFGFNKVAAGVRKASDKYSTHLETRMAINTMTDALKVTKSPAARKDLQDAIDAARGTEAADALLKAAKVERAQNQVNASKTNIKIRDIADDVKNKLDEDAFDADEIIKEFADELKKTSPTFSKIAEAIAKRIKRAADAAAGKDSEQSMGAAKRKTTPRTVVEDIAADHAAFAEALDATDKAFDAAVGAAKAAKDFKAQSALNAMRSMVKRGIMEKAKIAGVKARKVKLSDQEVTDAIGSKFKRYQKEINLRDNALNAVLKAHGSSERNILSAHLHKVMFQSGTSVKGFTKDIVGNPELGHKVIANLDSQFAKVIDDIYTAQGLGVKHTVVEDLGGALASTSRTTGEIKLRANLTREEILDHVRGVLVSKQSAQKRVVLNQSPGLYDRLEKMSLAELKQFILNHEFAHTKQDLKGYYSDKNQSMAEELGMATPNNEYLADSAIRLEVEANTEALKRLDKEAELYEALHNAYNTVRADLEWARKASQDRNAEEVALDPEWLQLSHEFQEMMGGDLKTLDDIYNSGFNKTLRNQFGGFTRSYAGELAASRTPLAQYAALHIFELPGGTGGKIARNETAAISMEMFEAAAVHPVNVAWDKAVRLEAKAQGLNAWKGATMRHSSAAADPNANALGRQVQLEMNARQQGKPSTAPAHIKEFADELERSYDLMYKTQFDNGVQGINGKNKLKSYMDQKWDNSQVLKALDEGGMGLEGMEQLIMKSLKSRNPSASTKDLRTQAKAVTDRMINNIDKRDGTPQHNIVTDGDYINERKLHLDLDVSMEINGRNWSMLELMDNDVVSGLHKYAKKTAAMSAISKATNGKLNSAEAISSFIHAVGAESQALGTGVDVGDMTNAFKLMMGEPIMGFDPRARKIRDAVALSGMNGLGESQLAELGLAMNRGSAGLFATMQVLTSMVSPKPSHAKWTGMKIPKALANDAEMLSNLQSVSTLYEDMHSMARQNVHFDEVANAQSTTSAMKGLNKGIDMVTGGKYRPVLQHVQTKYTGYAAIRTMQEKIAMAGLMHDTGRLIAGQKSMTSEARLKDIGLPVDLIRKKIKEGVIEQDEYGNITRMGLETWSEKERHSLGVALRRHSAQQVQVGFAGEQSALMNNPWVAFMMQFRSYPNIAAEKQQMRNAMFHDREAAMGLTLNAASSMAARVIRYHSLALAKPEEKREAYLTKKYDNLLHDTALYMGGVGTMMNTYDMVQDPTEAVPPVFNWANNYRKAIEGLGNGVTHSDISNIANAVALGTIAQMNLITGIIRTMMSDSGDDNESKSLRRYE